MDSSYTTILINSVIIENLSDFQGRSWLLKIKSFISSITPTCLLFVFLAILYWLKPPIKCSIEMLKGDILALFQMLEEKHSE